jgi:hypothetical protein
VLHPDVSLRDINKQVYEASTNSATKAPLNVELSGGDGDTRTSE